MKLREAQAVFFSAVVGPTGGTAPTDLWAGSALSAAPRRIELYRTMYRVRLIEALKDCFPRLASALGSRFAEVAREYVTACPSHDPVIEHVGDRLPAFLSRSDDTALVALAALAQLELARTRAFLAPDPVAVARRDALQSPQFTELRARFVPSFSLLRVSARTLRLWGECALEATDDTLIWTVVARRGFRVGHLPIGDAEGLALQALMSGATIGVACEAFQGPEAISTAARAFVRWFDSEWVAQLLEDTVHDEVHA